VPASRELREQRSVSSPIPPGHRIQHSKISRISRTKDYQSNNTLQQRPELRNYKSEEKRSESKVGISFCSKALVVVKQLVLQAVAIMMVVVMAMLARSTERFHETCCQNNNYEHRELSQ
jgi:hypothetical protein